MARFCWRFITKKMLLSSIQCWAVPRLLVWWSSEAAEMPVLAIQPLNSAVGHCTGAPFLHLLSQSSQHRHLVRHMLKTGRASPNRAQPSPSGPWPPIDDNSFKRGPIGEPGASFSLRGYETNIATLSGVRPRSPSTNSVGVLAIPRPSTPFHPYPLPVVFPRTHVMYLSILILVQASWHLLSAH